MIALLPIVVSLFATAPQDSVDEFSMRLRRERIELVRAKYADADEEGKLAVRRLFQGVKSAANPDGATLGLVELDSLLRALEPKSEEALTPEQALADALAPRVMPGAFEARTEGLGEPTTVKLMRTRSFRFEGDAVMSLYWVSPDGVETRARREVIPGAVLSAREVEMFIRPPMSEPGMWQLVCEVGLGEGAGRARPVTVECVKDLSARREALAASPRAALDGWTPMSALDELCDLGLRHSVLGASALLEMAERGSCGDVHAVRHDSGLEFQLNLIADAEGTLVVVGGSTYSPLELAAGASAEAWKSFAELKRLRVLFLDLPLVATGDRPSIAMRIEELHGERPEDALHLVAFGDASGFVPSMRARHPLLPLSSVTLVSDSLRRGGRDPRLDVRSMLVECSGDSADAIWSREEGFGKVLIQDPFTLAAPFIPELMLAWNRAR